LVAVVLTIVLACVATAVIALALKGVMGLRASPEVESTGLDISEHGEEAYII
jgi:Amt family ammonium transporter